MRSTRLTAVTVLAALALAGCADEPSSVGAATVPCVVDVELPQVDRVQFAAPPDWLVDGGCAFLDPEIDTLDPGTEAGTALSIQVTPASFADAADTSDTLRDTTRQVGTRSGYRAVRIEGVSTGAGLHEKGTKRLLWLVDLGAGPDQEGATLVASAQASGSTDFATAAAVLDRLADTLLVRPAASD